MRWVGARINIMDRPARLALAAGRIVPMCAPESAVYPLVVGLVQAVAQLRHLGTAGAVSHLVWAVLASQSVRTADVARALGNERAAGARQAMRRVRRALGRASLSSVTLTPGLIAAALRLVPSGSVTLVLDSTRCWRWEVFTIGVLFAGRVLPVAWSVLPDPWPKGQFTPTVVALLNRVFVAWPRERAVHLVADRGFPSLALFGCLARWARTLEMGDTIRLRAGDWVRAAGLGAARVRELLTDTAPDVWRTWRASSLKAGAASPPALLVVGRATPAFPAHQCGPADQARREQRAARRRAHVLSKGQPGALATDTVWALLSTHADAAAARAADERRFATEPTYRDLKGWGLEAALAHETSAPHVNGRLGLAALADFVQAAVGAAAGRTSDRLARARQQQWSTTDRLSVFWRGRQVLHDRAHDWSPWLSATLKELDRRLSLLPLPASPPRPPHLAPQQAAA